VCAPGLRRDAAPTCRTNCPVSGVSTPAPLAPRGRLLMFALAAAFAVVVGLAAMQRTTPALAAAAAPTSTVTSPPAALQRVPGDHLMPILGKDVVSATGEKMGPIVDVLFDDTGKPRAAVIDFGGFLGVGTRKIAIDWNALLFDMGDKKDVIALDISRKQLEAAPEYLGPDKPVSIVTLPRSEQSDPPSDAPR
jgi:hypothetical protein